MRSPVALLALGAVLAGLAACGGDESGPTTTVAGGCRSADAGRVTVVAEDLMWDTDCLDAPAGEPLVIVVENRDDGVNHNIHLVDAPEDPKTPREPGPVTQELEVTLPDGSYEYVCDIHPNMVGTLAVAGANS